MSCFCLRSDFLLVLDIKIKVAQLETHQQRHNNPIEIITHTFYLYNIYESIYTLGMASIRSKLWVRYKYTLFWCSFNHFELTIIIITVSIGIMNS